MKPAASHLPEKSLRERQQVVLLGKRWGLEGEVFLVINTERNEGC